MTTCANRIDPSLYFCSICPYCPSSLTFPVVRDLYEVGAEHECLIEALRSYRISTLHFHSQ
jgi:hypothetical protein